MLPQELVDLVMDDLASMNDTDTLRNSIYVSRAYHAPARKHVFANLEIVVDESVGSRARRLRKILENDLGLQRGIRSFKMHLSAEKNCEGRFWQHSKDLVAPNSFTRFGVFKEHVLWLTRVVSQAKVRKYSFVVEGSPLYWDTLDRCSQSLMLSICSSPVLETLELVNVLNLPATMITGVPTDGPKGSLHHLVLGKSTVRDEDLH
ncbi:hypothetical protein CPB84DRAFT_275329 [Gymnopilus junonius]|uniref:Uncharacterized protein n=1 Tax=Gymnopilus junonius TaxID=109634 RepID=A0A9P5NEN3_GYMJU|nr:hypothetical protein CPB84DRAFT_275329 [Gymnopilus junonius]